MEILAALLVIGITVGIVIFNLKHNRSNTNDVRYGGGVTLTPTEPKTGNDQELDKVTEG
jgi:hypothetical protein